MGTPSEHSTAARTDRRWQVILALLIAGIALAVWMSTRRTPAASGPAPVAPAAAEQRTTVAQRWQWQSAKQAIAEESAAPVATGRISPAAVVRALGRVQFDATGKVIVDRNARDVLEDSLQQLSELTAEELDTLQQTLRTGLPGAQGERVAKIVTDYYRYRTALQELERGSKAPATPEAERTQLSSIARLREEYLGPVVARQFYADDQALQRYLLESRHARAEEAAGLQQDLANGVFYLDSRSSPQAQELARQMLELRTQGASDDYARYIQTQQLGLYTAEALPRTPEAASDWQQRYSQFQRERQSILAAGLAEDDKKAQLEQLLTQYFVAEEIEAVHAYGVR